MKNILNATLRRARNVGYGAALLASCTSLFGSSAFAQSVPPAGVVFKNANVVMGYVTTSTPANIAGYPNCFTTMGSYLWLRSDNSANIEPVFNASVVGTQVKLTANQYAQGNAAYVCYANQFSTTDIRAGYVASGTNIGTGMSCVTSISNFLKGRVASGTVPGTVACNYNATTGVVTASYTSPGLVTNCGYICAVPNSTKVTNHFVKQYPQIFTGTENIGTGLNCAHGNNYFFTQCSSAGVANVSYNSTTGAVTKGYADGCGRNSYSYFCVDPSKRSCADGVDNDNDRLIDRQDPGCWRNIKDPTTYDPSLDNEGRATSECQDRADNDLDGATDFPNDFSCSAATDLDETNPKAACQNGLDDDGDGLADLADPGCANTQDNNEGDRTSQCQDGIDNDTDGATDFPADFSCSSRTDNDETNPRSGCQDGLDNDNDGLIDALDPGCANNQDNDESDRTSQCQDGVDNDVDGATDFPADFSCSSRTDNDERNPRSGCQDGVDNDGDGLVDLADPGCANNQDNDESDKTTQCQDGIDNDGDGLVDLADPGCATKQDNDESDKTSQCQDGIDNDGDGLVDLADPGCANKQDNDESDKTSQCQDGVDNDGDGATDFPADFSCSSRTDNDEKNPLSGCQDGLDNDKDGLTDLEDPGCSDAQDNNEGDRTSECQDKKDNDSDGLTDMDDPGCSSPQDKTEGDGTSACQDKLDNDADGLVDLADPGCSNPQDKNEVDDVSRLQVSAECVADNQDGSFTAYFGYENLTGTETTVVTDAAKSTINTLEPAVSGVTPTTTFKTGRQKGSFGVTFSGASIAWTVQIAAGVKSTATASRTSTTCKPVEPIAECIDSNSTGLTATFGYLNQNEFPVRVNLGTLNRFSPAPENRGQPTVLLAGSNKAAVVTNFVDQITWSLGGKSASVKLTTPVCEGGCVGTDTTQVKSSLDAVALELARLNNKAADFLATTATKNLPADRSVKLVKDAGRAKSRAAKFLKRANSLLLEFPAVVKSCPNAKSTCSTIDRQKTIEELRSIYNELERATRRMIARANFSVSGNTGANRSNKTVVAAKTTLQVGLTGLVDLPRFATECK